MCALMRETTWSGSHLYTHLMAGRYRLALGFSCCWCSELSKVCAVFYFYPATCGSKAHGSSGSYYFCKYSPYAKVLVETKTTPKNTIFAIFDLLYLNRHNIPTIENLGANT